MVEKLETYLEEIDHYLVVEKGGEEILSEIRSHILEKAEKEYGEVNEDTVEKIIAGYGSPKEIAAKYLEGYHIISPLYKKYLFRYTWVLFVFHGCLTILAYILNIKIQAFPIFYVPEMKNTFDLICQLPMTLLFDLGLVGVFFYFVTRQKGEVKLSWPKIFKGEEKEMKLKERKQEEEKPGKKGTKKAKPKKGVPKEPRLVYLVLMILGFCAVIFVYLKYHSLFFASLGPEEWEPLFAPLESTLFSLLVISFFGLEIICYVIRFFKNTHWVNLAKNGAYLIVLLFIINFPITDAFTDFSISDPLFIAYGIVRVLVFVLVIDSIVILVNLVRSSWKKWN